MGCVQCRPGVTPGGDGQVSRGGEGSCSPDILPPHSAQGPRALISHLDSTLNWGPCPDSPEGEKRTHVGSDELALPLRVWEPLPKHPESPGTSAVAGRGARTPAALQTNGSSSETHTLDAGQGWEPTQVWGPDSSEGGTRRRRCT